LTNKHKQTTIEAERILKGSHLSTERTAPPELRRERILSLVRDREFVRVSDLSDMFGISEVTVRSDLDLLDESSNLQRVHGGAIIRTSVPRQERSFEESSGALPEEKVSIG
jgi:DeoR family transcriptional regulator of aga operon